MQEPSLWKRLFSFRPSAVRTYLLFIAVSCTVPVAMLGGYFGYHFVSEAAARRQADVADRLRLMRNALDQRIERIVGELEVLAHAPDLQAGDLARFKGQAEYATRLIGGITVLLCDRDGNQFVAALQELTTNAAKYGALSQAGGALDVTWVVDRETIRLDWRESDGPPVCAPMRRGFGTKLINELLAKDTGWNVETEYRPAGFQCRIRMMDGLSRRTELAAASG